MIIEEIPKNPNLIYALIALGTVAITKVVDYFLKKSDNSSKIEIAKMNISEKDYSQLKVDLKSALDKLKQLKEHIEQKEKAHKIAMEEKERAHRLVLEEKEKRYAIISSDWKAVKFAFQILVKGYERIFKEDEDSLSMLSEMSEILNKKV